MIEIVTHCWTGMFSQYATHLRFQLSSLTLHPRNTAVQVTVCRVKDDPLVDQVLIDFPELPIRQIIFLEKERLFRRSIGRNEAALSSKADLVWFCDADYSFGPGCLDAVWESRKLGHLLMYPKWVLSQSTHEAGDEIISEQNTLGKRILQVDPEGLIPRLSTRAIGGLQIVRGDFCREHGYLNSWPAWQTPTDFPFNTTDDFKFRRYLRELTGQEAEPIEVPNLYRIRHSKNAYENVPEGSHQRRSKTR